MPRLAPLLIFPSAADRASATGRPSLRTPEIVARICAAIRRNGHTDTHAAALAGVSSSAVSRWRQEDEEFAAQLNTARADFLDARLEEIRGTRKRDGSPDWRAQVWLMQVVAPEIYGTPSRRHSLARDQEEKERAEEKALEENPQYWSQEDQNQLVRWRRYSIERMNGTPEEEARWLGHFALDASKPAFPGSLAVAGAVIPPEPKLTPEEEALRKSLRARRRTAHLAMMKQDVEMGRPPTPMPPDLLEDEAEAEPASHEAAARGAEGGDATARGTGGDPQNTTKLPETRDAVDAVDAVDAAARRNGTHQGGNAADDALQNAANIPESRGASPLAEAPGAGARRPPPGPAAPTPSTREDRASGVPRTEAESQREARDAKLAAHLAYLAASVAENDRFRATLPGGGVLGNQANLPETRPAADGGSPGDPGPGVPKAAPRRPLAGAALAAAQGKEWRRLNRLMEEQWERSTDRAWAAAEEANRDAIPGMTA